MDSDNVVFDVFQINVLTKDFIGNIFLILTIYDVNIRNVYLHILEVYYDRGNQHDFICLSKELAKAGELTQNTKFAFCFHNVSKPFESYVGTNVKLRYFLRVTVLRRLTDLTKELDLIVHTLASYPDNDSNIKMEVGIEDCLHIEFEYNRSR